MPSMLNTADDPRRRVRWPPHRHDLPGPLSATCYVGSLVELPPRTAAAAFDATVAGADRLLVGQAGTPGCLRSRYGTLLGARQSRRLAVEVTLEPWDRWRCELGVRPRRAPLLDPARPRVRWYLDAAAALLAELTVAMEHWALTSPAEPAAPRPPADLSTQTRHLMAVRR